MIVFEDTFPLNEAAPQPRSAIDALGLPGARARKPGVYANGLVVLVSADFDMSCLESWPPMRGERFAAIGYTAFGDPLLWDRKKSIPQFFDMDQGVLTKGGDTLDAMLDQAFTKPDIIESVLLRPLVEEIVGLKGALRYGECFILTPARFLGGNPVAKNYSKGDARVYANLVGQMHFGSDDK
jgi:hypothetical protein